ncbi:hypothetical protein [Streptomyces sp. NPDC002564]|uniref:hypothetical protein n=1 Tax=Streptomyces sp. NPDC002564 TaxID=3364649 RepID=UPI0036B5D797
MSSRARAQEPIEHGTVRGWRQHNRRHEPACLPCIEAKRTDNNAPRPPASTSKLGWNEGRTTREITLSTQNSPVVALCTVDGCGTEATKPRPAPHMVTVSVRGSSEPPRWYCPGRCRAIGKALADIRAIPTTREGTA